MFGACIFPESSLSYIVQPTIPSFRFERNGLNQWFPKWVVRNSRRTVR